MYKYSKVADSIRKGIREGIFKPGDRLPSIHSYAKETGYNSDTVVKAYKLLEEEHLIYSAPRSGYYVVKSMVKGNGTRNEIDLSTVRPPDSINPYKDFYHCMEKSITIYRNKLLEYAPSQGMEELRVALVKHLMNFHIFTRHQDIYITNGAQQALYILAAMPFPGNRSKVVVEQPTYSIILHALRCNHVPVIGIQRTEEGINLAELEDIFQSGDVKFFYTMPRFQNPTGYSYNERQKREIVRLASKYDVYVVEDDYLADLELNDKADSLYSLGDKERIIYIRSFSKTLLPGLRLGMTILPETLKKEFLLHKQCMDLNTPVLTQGALEIYLKSSMYKTHVVRTKAYYSNRMNVLKEACDTSFGRAVTYHIPATGIYAFIETQKGIAEKVVSRLKKCNVLVNSIKNCYIEDSQQIEGIRLCICNCADEDLTRAVMLVREELERCSK
ncbi:MAG TPA: PLP-dependent aminotransferase family protein [Lachnospiraceae bacterium]|nr:PLP-dependent aminotransferase family protein [Lachnospiraceae bacterium]